MRRSVTNERGTVIMVAVIGMLIMGVLALSFSLLASIETTIGVNFRQQAQAEALAEGALAAALNTLRGGSAGLGGVFTAWLDGTAPGSTGAHRLAGSGDTLNSGEPFPPGEYWARVDNDCQDAIDGFPTYAGEPSGCTNDVDNNGQVVVTAWAITPLDKAVGRSRVRSMIGYDSPWRRVCSNSINDDGGPYCNSEDNTKGNPAVIPASPAELNGPKGYNDLPRPIIGCSRIDPSLHGVPNPQFPTCQGLGSAAALFSQPAVGVGNGIVAPGYPIYPPPASAGGTPLVIMGEDPAITTVASVAKTCNGGGGVTYFGYFDCALTTYCDPSEGDVCPDNLPRKACLHPSDSRIPDVTGHYVAPTIAAGVVVVGCQAAGGTGMVFTVAAAGSLDFNTNVGSAGKPMTIYVQHDPAGPFNDEPDVGTQAITILGTLVVEGNLEDKNKTDFCTGGVQATPPTAPCPVTPITGSAYGYPLAVLAYDPKLPFPTVTPQAPQPILVNFGTPNTTVNGTVYSGGSLSFNPINVNGTSIGFDIDLQATSSTYRYMGTYGTASPPPGFASTTGTPALILKSFIVCSAFGSETLTASAAGACN